MVDVIHVNSERLIDVYIKLDPNNGTKYQL